MAVSCSSVSEEEEGKKIVTGDWLVLYVEHYPSGMQQKEVYRKIKDSIEIERGLKLLSFSGDGSFYQADSIHQKGQWVISPYQELLMADGGRGFDNFKGEEVLLEKDLLKLTEYTEVEGERLKLVWSLKKINAPALLGEHNNYWRQRPSHPETEEELRKRLSAMLAYYSGYFSLVTKQTNYFMPVRVPLPFKYYQHAMGMKDLSAAGAFSSLFYDMDQSRAAYVLLENTMKALGKKFPYKENFIEEYAAFIEMMSQEILTGQVTGR